MFDRVGWRWHADTTLVEERCKPTLFDMIIDDCDEEVSGGVSRVCRRRSVLVPTQLESTRPTVEDTDGPQTHEDGSDTESVDFRGVGWT